jgi:hypothetical protein
VAKNSQQSSLYKVLGKDLEPKVLIVNDRGDVHAKPSLPRFEKNMELTLPVEHVGLTTIAHDCRFDLSVSLTKCALPSSMEDTLRRFMLKSWFEIFGVVEVQFGLCSYDVNIDFKLNSEN